LLRNIPYDFCAIYLLVACSTELLEWAGLWIRLLSMTGPSVALDASSMSFSHTAPPSQSVCAFDFD